MSDPGSGGPTDPQNPYPGQQPDPAAPSAYPPAPPVDQPGGTPTGTPPPYGGYPPPPPQGGYPPPGQPGGYPAAQPGYPAPPAYPGMPYGDQPEGKAGRSGLALAALLVGLLLPLIGLFIAVPLGIVALVKISKSRQTGKWMAITGIVLSVLWWVALIGLVVFVASHTAERNDAGEITKKGIISFDDIKAGDCLDIDGLGNAVEAGGFDLQGVPCADTHNAESAGYVSIDSDDYPGEDELQTQAQAGCTDKLNKAFGDQDPTDYQAFSFYPTKELWNSSDDNHRVQCLLVKGDFSNMTEKVLQ